MNRHVFQVGDKHFALSEANYRRIEHTIVQTGGSPVIDRDPKIFGDYIWPYLIGYRIYLGNTDKETLWRIWSDAELYRLPELQEMVKKELGDHIALTPEEKEEKIKEEITKIKETFSGFAKLIGAFVGHRIGQPNLGETLIAELDEFEDELRECAVYTVENGGEFLNLNPKQKLLMAIGMKIYFKLFERSPTAEDNDDNGVQLRMWQPPQAFMNREDRDEFVQRNVEQGPPEIDPVYVRQFNAGWGEYLRAGPGAGAGAEVGAGAGRPVFWNIQGDAQAQRIPFLRRVPSPEAGPEAGPEDGPEDGDRAQEVAADLEEEIESHLINIVQPVVQDTQTQDIDSDLEPDPIIDIREEE